MTADTLKGSNSNNWSVTRHLNYTKKLTYFTLFNVYKTSEVVHTPVILDMKKLGSKKLSCPSSHICEQESEPEPISVTLKPTSFALCCAVFLKESGVQGRWLSICSSHPLPTAPSSQQIQEVLVPPPREFADAVPSIQEAPPSPWLAYPRNK